MSNMFQPRIANILCFMIQDYFCLIFPAPCISESCIKIEINLNCYFYTSFWCLKKFYEGLKGLHKTF